MIANKPDSGDLRLLLHRRQTPSADELQRFMTSYEKKIDYRLFNPGSMGSLRSSKLVDEKSAISYWRKRHDKIRRAIIRETDYLQKILASYAKITPQTTFLWQEGAWKNLSRYITCPWTMRISPRGDANGYMTGPSIPADYVNYAYRQNDTRSDAGQGSNGGANIAFAELLRKYPPMSSPTTGVFKYTGRGYFAFLFEDCTAKRPRFSWQYTTDVTLSATGEQTGVYTHITVCDTLQGQAIGGDASVYLPYLVPASDEPALQDLYVSQYSAIAKVFSRDFRTQGVWYPQYAPDEQPISMEQMEKYYRPGDTLTDAEILADPEFRKWKANNYNPTVRPEKFTVGEYEAGAKPKLWPNWKTLNPKTQETFRDANSQNLYYMDFYWQPDEETVGDMDGYVPPRPGIEEATGSEMAGLARWYYFENAGSYLTLVAAEVAKLGAAAGTPTRKAAIRGAQDYQRMLCEFREFDADGDDVYNFERMILGPNDKVEISYPETNSIGTLTAAITLDSMTPAVGDLVYLVHDEQVLFRGNITTVSNSIEKTSITAQNALGMLSGNTIMSVGQLDGYVAIYSICASAGAILWYYNENRTLDKLKKYSAYYSNQSYLDAVRDIMDRIAVEEGLNMCLIDVAGVLKLVTTESMFTDVVILGSQCDAWTIETTLGDRTFNRVLLSVKPQVSGDTEIIDVGNPLNPFVQLEGTTVGPWGVDATTGEHHMVTYNPYLAVMYGKFMTYAASSNTMKEASALQHVISENMFAPTYEVKLTGVLGVPKLQPGNSILLDLESEENPRTPENALGYKVKRIGNKGIRVLIDKVTHTWGKDGHVMDVVCTMDPNLDTGKRPYWSHEMRADSVPTPVYDWSINYRLRDSRRREIKHDRIYRYS
jgi:hypothetical protein